MELDVVSFFFEADLSTCNKKKAFGFQEVLQANFTSACLGKVLGGVIYHICDSLGEFHVYFS